LAHFHANQADNGEAARAGNAGDVLGVHAEVFNKKTLYLVSYLSVLFTGLEVCIGSGFIMKQ